VGSAGAAVIRSRLHHLTMAAAADFDRIADFRFVRLLGSGS
jgi:hypothetical protein